MTPSGLMTNIVNQIAYLQTSREFPEEQKQLSVEMNRTYVDIASAVNTRIIGIFSTNRPSVTGESWFFINQRQQSFRQVYPFTTTASIPHGVNLDLIYGFSRLFGTYTDGTNWYGLIPGSNVAIPGQISFYIDPINIVFLVGAGAPALTKGNLVIEWISNIDRRFI
jgi:hypothetical protein